MLLAGTGMRVGEALALRWEDVDLDSAKVQVRGSLQHVAGQCVFKAPKTASGRRTIALPEGVVRVPAAVARHSPEGGNAARGWVVAG